MEQESMQSETVLIVDDEESVCASLHAILSRAGYRTLCASDGSTAIKLLDTEGIDLVLVDLKMPGMSGLDLIRIIRERWPSTVVSILTGYGTLESAIAALRNGAHDYLLKPFTPEDIKASVRRGLDKRRTVQRRRQLLTHIEASVRALTSDPSDEQATVAATESLSEQETMLRAGDLVIDLKQHRVTLGEQEIALTPIEFSTLLVLVRNRGRVLSYAAIVKETHGYNCNEHEARTLIKTHISHLRQKIASHAGQSHPIANVRGVGYMWSDES
jgi:DNA-binding response OmpR family regulator